jgi:hypothetical protein
VLDVLAECGIAQTRRQREDGGAIYEESHIKALLGNGWAACGCAAGRVDYTLRVATQDGLLTEKEFDDWVHGMRSGSGLRTYFGLTFKGKKQAEKASEMPPVCDEEVEEQGEGVASSPGPAGPEAKHDEYDRPTKLEVTEVTEILELCGTKPNEAFRNWKALEEEVAQCAPLEEQNQGKDRATMAVFRGWFEECGHWRDLTPSAEDFAPTARVVPATHRRQIEEFMLTRKERLQFVEYDEVHADHTCRSEGTENAYTEYRWTYLLAGEPQLILTVQDYPAHCDAARTHYLRKAHPYGYAYSVAADIGRTCVEGCAYFRSGAYLEFICSLSGDIYPPNRCQPGDYQLRDVGKKTTLVEQIKNNTDLIPTVLQKVDEGPLRTAALLKGTVRQKLGTFGTVEETGFTASAHFTNLTWNDKRYVIRRTAAVIVETLFIAQKSFGLPGLHQDEVFAQVYTADKKKWPSGNARIQNFFRTKDAKRLWDDGFIVHDGKGNFRLNINIHTYTH